MATLERVANTPDDPEHHAAQRVLGETEPHNRTRYRNAQRGGNPIWIANVLEQAPYCARFLRPELRAALDLRVEELAEPARRLLETHLGRDESRRHWTRPIPWWGPAPFSLGLIPDAVDAFTLTVINFRSAPLTDLVDLLRAAQGVRWSIHALLLKDADFRTLARAVWRGLLPAIPHSEFFREAVEDRNLWPRWVFSHVRLEEMHEIRDFWPAHSDSGLQNLYDGAEPPWADLEP